MINLKFKQSGAQPAMQSFGIKDENKTKIQSRGHVIRSMLFFEKYFESSGEAHIQGYEGRNASKSTSYSISLGNRI